MKMELRQATATIAADRLKVTPLKVGRRFGQAVALMTLVACLGLVGLLLSVAIPKLWGSNSFVIYSSSMEPTIKVGSLIMAAPVDVDQVQVGDIIVFRTPSDPNTTITHRVVGVREEEGVRYFQTKGDATNGTDPVETPLSGRVYRFQYEMPFLGYFVHFAKGTLGMILLVVLPLAGLLALHWTKDREAGANNRETAGEG